MKNIVILYNPYYQKDVIEQHLEILKDKGSVAFGKVRSKLRDYDSPNKEELEKIYMEVSIRNPLQLFLTDYNSIYVANVVSVKSDKTKLIKAPKYYEELDVEKWFIFDDLRLLANNDFQLIRDNILSNFLATNYNNHTYAVYGNNYVYPMQVSMKKEINYFEKEEDEFKYFTNIFKSEEQINIKQNIIDFNFGIKRFYSLSPNTQDNLVNAELEFFQNRNNSLYDFSSVVIKYSKSLELELYVFMKKLFEYLMYKETNLKSFKYSVQGIDYKLEDILLHKANYATYKYLIKSYEIKNAIYEHIDNSKLKFFILHDIIYHISKMQDIRNESVHGKSASLLDCKEIRKNIMGIGKSSIIVELNRNLKYIK